MVKIMLQGMKYRPPPLLQWNEVLGTNPRLGHPLQTRAAAYCEFHRVWDNNWAVETTGILKEGVSLDTDQPLKASLDISIENKLRLTQLQLVLLPAQVLINKEIKDPSQINFSGFSSKPFRIFTNQ